MKYVIAVSGGVDSVVLLDMLVRSGQHELVVAHFEHGIRGQSSKDDARFVEALSAKYGLRFEIGHGNLGERASEDEARQKRYAFLKNVAKKHDAHVATAHHRDDLVETITINLLRGTGWRGLAVLGSPFIYRPLLGMTKQDIYDYALEHDLEWVEDETNQTDAYLRNRVRRKVALLPSRTHEALARLRQQQYELAGQIDTHAKVFMAPSRYFYTMIHEDVALELLRGLLGKNGLSLTRPQRLRLLHAIKTARPGDVFEAGQGVRVQFTLREFIVNQPL